MLIHCTMEELLAIRDGYGSATSKEHLEGCDDCMMEMERVYQRVAALKALPTIDAPRDRWDEVKRLALVERRKNRRWMFGWSGAAAAAIALLMFGVSSGLVSFGPERPEGQIAVLMQESQDLEGVLRTIKPSKRVLNGRVASTVVRLEDEIQLVDRRLSELDRDRRVRVEQLEGLWQQRVRLMESLVTVHSNRGTYVRF